MIKNVSTASSVALPQAKTTFKDRPSHKTFCQIFSEKKLAKIKEAKKSYSPMSPAASAMKTVLNNMVDNHEKAVASVKNTMLSTDQRPEELLKMQFKTGAFFLREQMFCKTAELFSNTLKNFTQMQV